MSCIYVFTRGPQKSLICAQHTGNSMQDYCDRHKNAVLVDELLNRINSDLDTLRDLGVTAYDLDFDEDGDDPLNMG
jgi:hypothetical protein